MNARCENQDILHYAKLQRVPLFLPFGSPRSSSSALPSSPRPAKEALNLNKVLMSFTQSSSPRSGLAPIARLPSINRGSSLRSAS